MKKCVLVILSFLALSCAKEEAGFKGFGDLVLGADFKSVKHADKFETVLPNEFFMMRYELDEEIGPVGRVYVTTSGGKITEVKFNAEDETNLKAMKRHYSKLERFDVKVPGKLTAKPEYYASQDSSALLCVIRNPAFTGSKKNPYQFIYIDRKEMEARTKAFLEKH